jgi:hypothetical protein
LTGGVTPALSHFLKEEQMSKLLNLKAGVVMDYIEERVTRSQFTDGGSTAGTYTMKAQIPIGALTAVCLVTDVIGFTGDTSAVMIVGDGSDTDRYNTSTIPVFTTAAMVAAGAPSGTLPHVAAIAPVLTVTSASDFTNVTAGAVTVRIVYWVGGK